MMYLCFQDYRICTPVLYQYPVSVPMEPNIVVFLLALWMELYYLYKYCL